MNKYVYVVSLAGKHVFHDWLVECVIKDLNSLDKVRAIIKERYGIEFEKVASQRYYHRYYFISISDYRDIKLIVERVDVLD